MRRGSALADRLRGVVPLLEINPILGEFDFIAAHILNRRLKAEKIDVVHAHTGHAVSLAAMATCGTDIPFVLTRRVDFHLSPNMLSRWKYRRAARVVAISEGVRDILLQDGIPPSKITVVPSGVDFDRYKSVRAVSKTELGFDAGDIVIGQVAALAPHKDQNTFIEAMEILRRDVPNAKAVIVGEGELRPVLEANIRARNLTDSFKLIGFKENPLDYLAAFDVFCLSSKEEGLGTSVIDAMAVGIPVVATNVGGIPELVEEGKTGYLVPGRDPIALANALKNCIASPERNRLLHAQAQEKARKFSIIHTVTGMESLYGALRKGV